MRLFAVTCLSMAAAAPVRGGDAPQVDRQVLLTRWRELHDKGLKDYFAGKHADAERACTQALELARRLFPQEDFPKGHPNLATSRSALAFMLYAQGRYSEAERHLRAALETRRRFFSADHPAVAKNLNDLGEVLRALGRWGEAEPFLRKALQTRKLLFKGDHPDVATSLHNLAAGLFDSGKLLESERLMRSALEMRRRLHPGDHPAVAQVLSGLALILKHQGHTEKAVELTRESLAMNRRLYPNGHDAIASTLNNLATCLFEQGKVAQAEIHFREALNLRRTRFGGDHPLLALGLSNLGLILREAGKFAEAERIQLEALAMRRRLYREDHPELATSLNNLGFLRCSQGKPSAILAFREALGLRRKTMLSSAVFAGEGRTLSHAASLPLIRDMLLSADRKWGTTPSETYRDIFPDKNAISRVFEHRHQAARAAALDPETARLVAGLAEARRRRAELLLAPAEQDPATRKQREEALRRLEGDLADLERTLRPRLPLLARSEKLAAAQPADLQKALPDGTAVVDYLRFVHFAFDRTNPAKVVEKRTPRYLAFVLTKEAVKWVDLETAATIEPALADWRKAITSGKAIPPVLPAKVRALIWEPVRNALPSGIMTVYVCPDADLCRLPFAALPGDRPGTILLEDFAVAMIPHAPFLLDQLWPADPLKNPPTGTLVVGGVKYDAETAPAPMQQVASRSTPLLKEGAKLGWSFLPGTVGEANGVQAAVAKRKGSVTRLEGDDATPDAVLAALPKAKVAHLATHGFFADPSFRSIFQLDEKDYERARWGERIGRAVNSPLLMTGLVFAGANHPKTPGRGIVTGEALVDLDLSGLELAVLSACETGLGDVAGGEGTFGLQRAFHLAGTRNVIASLWKVPDQPTAALMGLFYRNLWQRKLPPIEALRQTQLEIYRHPDSIADLAKSFRGRFEEVPGAGVTVPTEVVAGRTHPLLWAAFTLSGAGR